MAKVLVFWRTEFEGGLPVTRTNKTFIGAEPSWANACVGDNGAPGYWEYAKGFSQAANILIALVLKENSIKYSVDELIYPVCFNMRHSVELRLKGAITELMSLEKYRSRDLDFDLVGSHHIGNIWSFFADKARAVDDRFESVITRLDSKISDIAEIDATGQTFRYPLDTESRKHLVDVSIISFFVLKRSFAELEAALDDLHQITQYLINEYQWGSYTKQLSRKNLFEIAYRLPERLNWGNESFRSIKEEIKKDFMIGSSELSESIRLIEKHYELAPLLGISMPLLGVEENYILDFFGHWFKQHELLSDKAPTNYEISDWDSDEVLKSIADDTKILAEVWESYKTNLTPEKLAGLFALFYFAHYLDFSECYIQTYSLHLQDAKVAFSTSERAVREQFFHLYNKTNAIANIIKSLYFLCKTECADRLVTTYRLDEKFSWLADARKRTFFRKPDYCGYTVVADSGAV
jgi:hypothetical protein